MSVDGNKLLTAYRSALAAVSIGATVVRMIDDARRGLVYVVERDGRITAVIRP